MIREYSNNVNSTQDSWAVSDPYYFVRIDALNHGSGGIQRFYMATCEKSEDVTIKKEDFEDFSWYKMKDKSSNASMTFTKAVTIPAEGYYLVELMINKNTKASKSVNVDLSVDDTSIFNDTGFREWDDRGVVLKCSPQYWQAGTKSFVLTLPKFVQGGWIKVSQITRYEGGKEVSGPSETRLDLISAEFTKNGVNDLDYLKLVIAMKDDYWTEELGSNPMAFDLGDSITLTAGQDRFSTAPVFGGYVLGWELNDDATELTLHCIDRLWDLSRNTVWRNFYIGTPPTTTNTGSFNYTQFPSVNAIARYLSTSLYAIDYSSVTKEYILYNSFSDPTDITGMINYGFDLKLETSFGHPGTCMRLIPVQVGVNSLTWYSDTANTWDATIYNTFSFDYFASGAGVKYPLQFNIEIDMCKDGQDSTSAVTYVIPFNGPTPTNSKLVLDTPTVMLNGQWQRYTIDLDKAFDKIAPSSHYYICAIRLTGQQPVNTVLDRRCSSLYIDQIMGYGSYTKAPSYKSADSKTALAELQELCEKCNHFAYTRPGMSRDLDTLILLPKAYYTLPIRATTKNIISVSNIEYKPADWGMINTVMDSYNIKDKTSVGYVEAYDNNAELQYGVIMDHEFHQDVASAASVQTIVNNKVANNSIYNMGFDMTIKGSALIEPGQYMQVTYPKFRINGTYLVSAIVHKIDFVNEYYTTELEFERPSGSYQRMMSKLKKSLKTIQNIQSNNSYLTAGSIAAGYETSLGAYS